MLKRPGLKGRFILIVSVVYLAIGLLTLLAFYMAVEGVVRTFGADFAIKQVLLEKTKLLSVIQREAALALKLVDSPVIKKWMLDEDNLVARRDAFAELESFRQHFADRSCFVAVWGSHRYYNIPADGKMVVVTLREDAPSDVWYFKTMEQVESYALNLDFDVHVKATKVWVNAIVKNEGRKIGVGGSGIDITGFVNEIVSSGEDGVSTILIDRDGAIMGHKNKEYLEHNARVWNTGKRKITIYDQMAEKEDRAALAKILASLAGGTREVETSFFRIGGKRYLMAGAFLKEIGWYNIVLLDISKIISIRDFMPILGIIVFSLLSLIVIITLLLNRIVLTPLVDLTASSREIARGNYDVILPVARNDELGMVSESFNHMVRTVRDYTENLEHRVNERTEDLLKANRQLEESNRLIMDSIRYAQMIQSSVLPKDDVLRAWMPGFFVVYRPRDVVGGDFYYFREHGDSFLIAVADCTGHGVPGAFMTMIAHAVLNHITDALCPDDPATILKELNRIFKATLQQDAGRMGMDNGLDIGICYCKPAGNEVVFAGAKMSLFCAVEGELREIKGDRQPIGYSNSDAGFGYANSVLPAAGATFYLATDGLMDQSGGDRGLAFGNERFRNMIIAAASRPLEEQKELFEETLREYQGSRPQRDDITFLGFRI